MSAEDSKDIEMSTAAGADASAKPEAADTVAASEAAEKPSAKPAKAKPSARGDKSEAKESAKRSRSTARAEKPKRQPDPDLRRKVLIGLAIFAVVVVMLYRPMRDLYIAWRTGYTLNVRYEALAEENEELNDDLERLMTREGIEDAARERGFVMPGETSVKVEGLEEEPEEDHIKASDVTGEEDLPWYIRVGDVIFFYRTDS
jgi:nitroreductase